MLNSYSQKIKIRSSFNIDSTEFEYRHEEIIILTHGLFSSFEEPPIVNLFEELSKTHNVVAFNAIGENKGIPTLTEHSKDLSDVLNIFYKKGAKNISLIGHSLGAIASLINSIDPSYENIIKKLVLISMPYLTREFENRYKIVKNKEKTYIILKNRKHELKKGFIEDMYAHDISHYLKKLNIPTLIIQGYKDNAVKPTDARLIYADIFSKNQKLRRQKELVMIRKAGHLFIDKKFGKALVSHIQTFLFKKFTKKTI